MSRELLAILINVPAVAALVVAAWWLTVRLVPPEPRRLVKWLYPAIVLVLAVTLVGGWIAGRVGQGDFVCVVCGGSTGMITFGSL